MNAQQQLDPTPSRWDLIQGIMRRFDAARTPQEKGTILAQVFARVPDLDLLDLADQYGLINHETEAKS